LIERYKHEWKKDLIQKRDAKTCMEKHQRRQGAYMLGNRRKLSPYPLPCLHSVYTEYLF
jgi:hypothetical protein